MSEEQQQELSLEELDRQEQQAYAETLASRNEARTEEVPTQELAKEEAQPQEKAPVEQSEPEPEKPIFAGLTETQLKAKLDRIDELDQLRGELATETRKVYGKVGELNGELKQLRELQRQAQFLSPEAVAQLQEEYPELARILASGSSTEQRGKSADDIEREFNERLSAAIGESSAKVEMKILTVMHPDWYEIKESNEFDAWKKTLHPQKLEELESSRDALVAADGLTKFKAWRNEYRKQQEATAEAERQKQDKQARLEAAAQPSGVAPAAQKAIASEEEAYAQARAEAARLRRRR